MLEFIIDKQRLSNTSSSFVVADSRNYLTASFIFSSDWNDALPKVAIFNRIDKEDCCYSVYIEDGKCEVPWEVLQDKGLVEVSVQGGDLITTNPVIVSIERSGANDGLKPTRASPSLYSYLIDEINCIKELELIAKYEVTKETAGGKAINISIDSNGDSFELKNAVLVVKTVITSSGTIYADGRINNVYISNLVKGLANKNITVISAEMNKLGDKYLCDYVVCKLNTDRYATSGTRQVGKMFFSDSIKAVGITSNVTFDEGTVIELYGRRY